MYERDSIRISGDEKRIKPLNMKTWILGIAKSELLDGLFDIDIEELIGQYE
jgi:hypothetical protein